MLIAGDFLEIVQRLSRNAAAFNKTFNFIISFIGNFIPAKNAPNKFW